MTPLPSHSDHLADRTNSLGNMRNSCGTVRRGRFCGRSAVAWAVALAVAGGSVTVGALSGVARAADAPARSDAPAKADTTAKANEPAKKGKGKKGAAKAEAKAKGEKTKSVPDQVSGGKWMIHDMNRPKPEIVQPGQFPTPEKPSVPPSDAVVIFNGKATDKLKVFQGDQPWKIENGVMTVDGTAWMQTADAYGDVQMHVEWASPTPPTGEGQGRGNSGIYFMDGKYEVQVLDSYQNETYADGQATAIYGQHPPLVNASRPPGEWQTYDIIFRGPRWDDQGKLTRPTTITVFHNGVLTQDHFQLVGESGHYKQGEYKQHPTKLPINFQNHKNPVKYRQIWLRPLAEVGERGQKLEQ